METRFPRNSIQSRETWLVAAKKACANAIRSYQLPGHRGPNGEKLYMDVAYFGAARPKRERKSTRRFYPGRKKKVKKQFKKAKRILTMRSGNHGPEETAGTGLEIDLMELMVKSRDWDPSAPVTNDAEAIMKLFQEMGLSRRDYKGGIGIILIRAVNPWGAAYIARFDQDFIDNNRCWLDIDPKTGKFYPEKLPPLPEIYNRQPTLEHAAVPEKLDPETVAQSGEEFHRIWQEEWEAELAKAKAAEEQGIYYKPRHPVMDGAMRGQYNDPRLLNWGGDSWSWSSKILHKVLDPFYRDKEVKAYDNDYHTGIGEKDKPPGSLQVLLVAKENGEIHLQIKHHLEDIPKDKGRQPVDVKTLFNEINDSVSTWVEGSAAGWINKTYNEEGKEPRIIAGGIEFRPLDGVEPINLIQQKGLRLAAVLRGDKDEIVEQIKLILHHYFCPDDIEFERNAKNDNRRLTRYQLEALAA